MKIQKVSVRMLEVPLPEPGFRPAWSPGQVDHVIPTTLAEVYTDEGLIGLAGGETMLQRAMPETIAGVVAPQLIGRDPLDTESCIEVIRRADRFGATPWWLEMALWDLVGKAAGLPIWRLWGGGSSRLRAYASTGEVQAPERRAETCLRLVESGFRAIKLRVHGETVREDVAIVESVRRAVGPDVALMVDANQGMPTTPRWTFRRALETSEALAPLGITWLEEPLPRHQYADLGALRARSPIPIAGGETNQDPDEYLSLFQMRAIDVIQPDVTLSEGMWGQRLLARLAEIHGIQVVPHTWSSAFGLVANFQLAASLPYCPYLEYPHDPPVFTAELFAVPTRPMLVVEPDGYVAAPIGPGLGIELDREQVERYTISRWD